MKWDMGPHSTGTLSPASDIWWQSLETCSKLFTSNPPSPLTGTNICWLLKHVRLAQADATHPTGMLSCQFEVGITLSFLS